MLAVGVGWACSGGESVPPSAEVLEILRRR